VTRVTGLPQVAAGGIMSPRQVRAVVAAGAVAARGDSEQMSLWAGQGYRSATEQPAGEIIERLSVTT
jgi:NAD(P)H-dependent flavin oxidoreductase YrpB (nitropropane dioxygenase family)